MLYLRSDLDIALSKQMCQLFVYVNLERSRPRTSSGEFRFFGGFFIIIADAAASGLEQELNSYEIGIA